MQSLGRLFSILYRKSVIHNNTVLEEFNITAAEQPFLLILYNRNGASQDTLSSILMTDKATTARAIASLIKKGYVRREKDQRDKRVNRVYHTEKAAAIRERLMSRLSGWDSYLLEGESEEDIEATFRVLEHMVEKIENIDIKELSDGDQD